MPIPSDRGDVVGPQACSPKAVLGRVPPVQNKTNKGRKIKLGLENGRVVHKKKITTESIIRISFH
jgi:hypothetical protein